MDRMGNIATTADILNTQQNEKKVQEMSLYLNYLNIFFLSYNYDGLFVIFFFLCFQIQAFQSELHSYEHHIELFNQLTQKILTVYPKDDTTRIQRMTENVNMRFQKLNKDVAARGKMLLAAMQNLQSFDRQLDKVCSIYTNILLILFQIYLKFTYYFSSWVN